jgi:hypothetical protein
MINVQKALDFATIGHKCSGFSSARGTKKMRAQYKSTCRARKSERHTHRRILFVGAIEASEINERRDECKLEGPAGGQFAANYCMRGRNSGCRAARMTNGPRSGLKTRKARLAVAIHTARENEISGARISRDTRIFISGTSRNLRPRCRKSANLLCGGVS